MWPFDKKRKSNLPTRKPLLVYEKRSWYSSLPIISYFFPKKRASSIRNVVPENNKKPESWFRKTVSKIPIVSYFFPKQNIKVVPEKRPDLSSKDNNKIPDQKSNFDSKAQKRNNSTKIRTDDGKRIYVKTEPKKYETPPDEVMPNSLTTTPKIKSTEEIYLEKFGSQLSDEVKESYKKLDPQFQELILLNEPSDAYLKEIGMTRSDAFRLRILAIANNFILGFRPINEDSARLMNLIDAVGKLFQTKGKSSLIGPLKGLIPFEAWLSKAFDGSGISKEVKAIVEEYQGFNNYDINKSSEKFYKQIAIYLLDIKDDDADLIKELTVGKFAASKNSEKFDNDFLPKLKIFFGKKGREDLSRIVDDFERRLIKEGVDHDQVIREFKERLLILAQTKYKDNHAAELDEIKKREQKIKFEKFVEKLNLSSISGRVNYSDKIDGVECELFFLTDDFHSDASAPLPRYIDGDFSKPAIFAQKPREGGGYDLYQYDYDALPGEDKYKLVQPEEVVRILSLIEVDDLSIGSLKIGGRHESGKYYRSPELVHLHLKPIKVLSYLRYEIDKDSNIKTITSPVTADYDQLAGSYAQIFLLENNSVTYQEGVDVDGKKIVKLNGYGKREISLARELESSVSISKGDYEGGVLKNAGEQEELKAILVRFEILRDDNSFVDEQTDLNKFLSEEERKFLYNFFTRRIFNQENSRPPVPVNEIGWLNNIFKKFGNFQEPDYQNKIKLDYQKRVLLQKIIGKLERRGSVTDFDILRLEDLLIKFEDVAEELSEEEEKFLTQKLALIEINRLKTLLDSSIWYTDGGLLSDVDLTNRTFLKIDTKGNVNHGAEVKNLLHHEKFIEANHPFVMPDGGIVVLKTEQQICEFINDQRSKGYPITINPLWNWGFDEESKKLVVLRNKIDFKKVLTAFENEKEDLLSLRYRFGEIKLALDNGRNLPRTSTLGEIIAAKSRPVSMVDRKSKKKSFHTGLVAGGDVMVGEAVSGRKTTLQRLGVEDESALSEKPEEIIGKFEVCIEKYYELKKQFYDSYIKYKILETSPRMVYLEEMSDHHKTSKDVERLRVLNGRNWATLKSATIDEYDQLLNVEIEKAKEEYESLWLDYCEVKNEFDQYKTEYPNIFNAIFKGIEAKEKEDEFYNEFSKLTPERSPSTISGRMSSSRLSGRHVEGSWFESL